MKSSKMWRPNSARWEHKNDDWLTGISTSLQGIDQGINWEEITDNLTWGDDDDHLIEDETEEAMQMG
jgi:hypothetical protein